MKINTVLGLLADSVRNAKQDTYKHNVLQTFAVLRNPENVSTENLGKNRLYTNKKYFYSRRWENLGKKPSAFSFSYPAMFAYVQSSTTEKPFQFRKHCHSVLLECVYPNVDMLGEDHRINCAALPVEEIYELMENHMMACINYLKGVIYAEVDGTNQWHHRGFLDQAIVDGKVTAYTENELATRKFQNMLQRENSKAKGNFIDDFGPDKLCGVSKMLTFCDDACQAFEYNFNTSNCCKKVDV